MAGIYIHIPFCKQACNYCNFYFTTSPRLKAHFVQSLLKEIEISKHFFEGEKVETIYFGGGTPTQLDVSDLIEVSEAIFKEFECNISEFTIEANPDDLSEEKLKELAQLKQYGLNRFSIGVQSFFEEDLRYMNRAHTANEALSCIKRTQDKGFDLLTIDLIYGTPTLSNEQWMKNLETVKQLSVPHFSSYALTVEENTALWQKIKHKKLQAVDEGKASLQFEMLMNFAKENDFEHYEISNLAKAGKRAIHNSNYWKGNSYLGLGPSAHSYKPNFRSWNVANLKNYIEAMQKGNAWHEVEQLTPVQMANEMIMTSLRTLEGLNLQHELITPYRKNIEQQLAAVDKTFFSLADNQIALTQKGKHFADAVALALWLEE